MQDSCCAQSLGLCLPSLRFRPDSAEPAGVKDSAAISQAIITGGAVAGASFALFQAHPMCPDSPLIDFDLALLLVPALLLGTSIGELACSD